MTENQLPNKENTDDEVRQSSFERFGRFKFKISG